MPITTTRRSPVARRALSVLRTLIGLYFLLQGSAKLATGWLASGADLATFVRPMLPHSVGFYRAFLEGVVLPNPTLFAQLVTVGELVVGVSLVFGLLTRIGALTAIWLTLNYALLKGPLAPAALLDVVFLAAGVGFLRAPTGLVWGLDARLRGRFHRSAATRWAAGIDGSGPGIAPAG